MKLIKVEEDKTLARDSNTGAILATDKESLAAYRRSRNIIKGQRERLDNLENEFREMKSLLNNIIKSKE